MFKNKHVIVAMLVAPVLAILAWFAVDYFVAERPEAAAEGGTYPLVARSNCRYDSGSCDLANEDFEVSLRPAEITATGVSLALTSRFPLQQVTIGLVDGDIESSPANMSVINPERTEWSGDIPAPGSDESILRVAVVSNGATFFAEVPVVFMVMSE